MIVLLLVNLVLGVFVFFSFKKKFSDTDTRSLLKHMGLLEAAWTGFLFTLGLFILFDLLETKPGGKSLLEIAGQERMMIFSVLGGFGIIHLSILGMIAVKLFKNRAN